MFFKLANNCNNRPQYGRTGKSKWPRVDCECTRVLKVAAEMAGIGTMLHSLLESPLISPVAKRSSKISFHFPLS